MYLWIILGAIMEAVLRNHYITLQQKSEHVRGQAEKYTSTVPTVLLYSFLLVVTCNWGIAMMKESFLKWPGSPLTVLQKLCWWNRDLKMLGFLSSIPEAVAIFCVYVLFLNSKGNFDDLIVLNAISCCMVLCPEVEL